MKKKLFSLLTIATMTAGLCACGASDSGSASTASGSAASNTASDSDSDSSDYEVVWWWERIDWDSFEEKKDISVYSFFDGTATDGITLDVIDEHFRYAYRCVPPDENNIVSYKVTSMDEIDVTLTPTEGDPPYYTSTGGTTKNMDKQLCSLYPKDDLDSPIFSDFYILNFSDEDMDGQDCLANGWWYVYVDLSNSLNRSMWFDYDSLYSGSGADGKHIDHLFSIFGKPDYIGTDADSLSYGFSPSSEVLIEDDDHVHITASFQIVYDYGNCVITYPVTETNSYYTDEAKSYYTRDSYSGSFMYIYSKECWEEVYKRYLEGKITEWLTPEEIAAI